MFKKLIISIIGITILIATLITWRTETYSATSLPYAKPADCTEATVNEIYLMRKDWNANLQTLLDQEKPTSKMVDDAFSGLRTYRCWLDYLCEAVLFSANADAKVMTGSQLTEKHIQDLPGCVSVDQVVITSTKLKYMPECQVNKTASNVPVATQADDNYKVCKNLVALEFAEPTVTKQDDVQDRLSKKAIEKFKGTSGAYVGLERALKTNSASQKGRILNKKISSILTQMHGLEAHVTYLREYMERFDALMPCFAAKCD